LPKSAELLPSAALDNTDEQADSRSSFPFPRSEFLGGEDAALAHLAQYLARGLPHSYKATRNGLSGVDYSSKLSPWLACGALSPRQVLQQLRAFEAEHGASESSYWLWFELLWRDYFKLLQIKYGKRLYRAGGLPGKAIPSHTEPAFQRWRHGNTGQPLVDAGMRELAATGYLGNRLRQIVASYLIHDLQCDWRAGAAWFESALIDYDCSINHGNWLYIAGLGTDPRGGRRFNTEKQAAEYDADGAYRALWRAA
jgi:deoxyribodipyrimidine photo-lyase